MSVINIGFTISNNYSQHLAVTMASILSNANSDIYFNFYVLNCGDITVETKRKIDKLRNIREFNVEYLVVNNEDFKNYATGVHISTNYRLRIASLLPKVEKILFLDVDVVVLSDLGSLWNTDIEDYYMAAVADPCQKLMKNVFRDNLERFPDVFYNTGIILLNLKKWREDNIENKILDGLRWFSANYEGCWPDQSTLNMVLKDKIKRLPDEYNACPILAYVQTAPCCYDSMEDVERIFKNPCIIHYAAAPEFKAWEDPDLVWADVYWKYLRETPFYEDALVNLSVQTNSDVISEMKDSISDIKHIRYVNFRYRKYKLLQNLTIGKLRQKYVEKYKKYKTWRENVCSK